jgi:hypothetical protein
MIDEKAPTHIAFARQRVDKRHGQWLEIGCARLESDGAINLVLNRTPFGGFNGHIYLSPVGTEPPGPEPRRPPYGRDEENT